MARMPIGRSLSFVMVVGVASACLAGCVSRPGSDDRPLPHRQAVVGKTTQGLRALPVPLVREVREQDKIFLQYYNLTR